MRDYYEREGRNSEEVEESTKHNTLVVKARNKRKRC